ncbi:transketolase [Candidatus Chlorohelix sp.]|uniref:transketolase n=1 Tax=Candidatus Chlorohelix sp. TaxID=3139201 RepID=UPI003056FB85
MTLAQEVKQIILEQSKRANVGHIGSNLSIADIVTSLYTSILQISDPDDPERDRFILSKGHASLALYASLYLKGWLTKEELNTYCGEDSLLGVHPEHKLKGVDFSTGSLGQGLSMATGAALAARYQGSQRRVFAVISDAECNEGSTWEAVMFAAHHKLANLIVIIDLNGQQAIGYTEQVLSLSPMSERWKAFGWDVHEVDGHNSSQIINIVEGLNTVDDLPHVLIAKTTFGKGVSFMERQIKWHYYPMSDEEYQQALNEIRGS